jgi:membrane fusion protein, multidrug efflux system
MDTAPSSNPGAAGKPIKTSSLRLAAMVIFCVVVLAAVAGIVPRLRARSVLKAETMELAIPNVLVVRATQARPGEGLLLPAEVRPFIEAPIHARASGYLRRWLVDIGAKVQPGDLLAEIDTPELDQELTRSRAELLQAEAALGLARTSAARWSELLKTSSVSEQETAEKQADLALKLATVDASQATVHRLEELKAFSRVTAPFAGIITSRRTDVGELIAAGSGKELFRLAQIGVLRVYVRVPQSLTPGIAPGQTADLLMPESPGRVYIARVVRSSGAIDAQSRTLLTELQVDNSKGEILSGSFAQVRFSQTNLQTHLTLPSNTLLFRPEGPQVGVVLAGGKVEMRTVDLGRDYGATVEILGGISASEDVILNPSDSLTSGLSVRVSTGDNGSKPQ